MQRKTFFEETISTHTVPSTVEAIQYHRFLLKVPLYLVYNLLLAVLDPDSYCRYELTLYWLRGTGSQLRNFKAV